MKNKLHVLTDEFDKESDSLRRERVRLGCIAIAILKPLFLPLFFLHAQDSFPLIVELYAAIVAICAGIFRLTYNKKLSPNLLATALLVSTYWLVIVSTFITGASRSLFFPLFLMCLTGIGLIAAWSLRMSAVIFGLITVFYLGGTLLLDEHIRWPLYSINLMSILDATVVGTLGIYLLERLRVEEFKKRINMYKEREALGRLLHDSLGSDFHTIGLLSELAQQGTNGNPGCGKSLALINASARNGLECIRDFIWSVDPEGISAHQLSEKIRDYGNALLGQSGVSFAFRGETGEVDRVLSPLYSGNIYLLYKEALANVLKHAHAGSVEVSLLRKDGKLNLEINDNGAGFDPAAGAAGRGIHNMKRRASDMNAAFMIQSAPGAGTRVSVAVPMQ